MPALENETVSGRKPLVGFADTCTKAGSSHARRLLVEAAWHYRRLPATGTTLARRQDGIDTRVIAVAWRSQIRLHKRYTQMKARNKPAGVITIANARELACFCSEACCCHQRRR